MATGQVEAEKTISVPNTGDWQAYRTYTLDTQVMTVGQKTLDLTFLSSRGQYSGNLEKLSISLKEAVDAVHPSVWAGAEAVEAIYTPSGLPLKELQPGINIVRMRDAQGNPLIRKVMK